MEIFSVEPILFYELISHKLKQMLIQKRLRDSLDRQKSWDIDAFQNRFHKQSVIEF